MKSIFRQILPEQIELGEIDPSDVDWDESLLFESERRFIQNAVDRRQQEFLAGRMMARSAMVRLGIPPQEVAAAADRSPIWPSGVTGSISHTEGWCVAAVARSSDVMAVGIDVEKATPLPDELIATVLTDEEIQQLGNSRALGPNLLAKLVFCAKEAAYKAQFTVTRTFLEFDAFNVRLDERAQSWHAEFRPGFRPPGFSTNTIAGRWQRKDDFIATSVVLDTR